MTTQYGLGVRVGIGRGIKSEIKRNSKEIRKIIRWLKSIAWCNAHDTAWIESTIEKLKKSEGTKK